MFVADSLKELNQTQEDVTEDMTSSHIIRDADFFDLSDPEKR